MSMGGGGGASAPDYTALANTQKEIYYDVKEEAQPYTRAGRDLALPALLYEFGLGQKPFLTPDGQVVYEQSDGTYTGGATQAATGSNTYDDQLSMLQGWNRVERGQQGNLYEEGPQGTVYVTPDRASMINGRKEMTQAEYNAELQRLRDMSSLTNSQSAAAAQGGSSGTLSSLPAGSTQLGGYTKTPGYDFRLQEGQNSLMSAMNAAGTGKDSGAVVKAATRYGQDYATADYQNYLNGLGTITGLGQFGVSTTAGAAQNYSSQLTNIAGMQQQAYNQAQARSASNLAGIGQLVGTLGGAAISGGVFS